MKEIAPYVNFNGNCRDAMKFYESIFGGELKLMSFADMKQDVPKDSVNRIMHANLRKGPFTLMASDTLSSDAKVSGNNVSVMVDCSDVAEIERFAKALAQGGKTEMPCTE